MMGGQTGGAWPNEQQELLLRATLLTGDSARHAWREWRAHFQIDDEIDTPTFHLLPLLGRNLETLGVEDDLLGRLKGLAKRVWVENQLRFRVAEEFAARCAAQGIPVLWLRGGALIANHYRDAGLRVMDDVDLMVPSAQVAEAAGLLHDSGWKSAHHPRPQVQRQLESPIYKACFCASGFLNEPGTRLNLHWQLFPTAGAADEAPWQRAVTVEVNEQAVQVLNPAELLLHLISHELRWQNVPPLRWLADCVTILRTAPDLDWSHLLKQARHYHLVLELEAALHYLTSHLQTTIPAEFQAELHEQTERVSAEVRTQFKLKMTQRTADGNLLAPYHHYLALQREPNAPGKIISYNTFLRHYWGLDYAWQVPVYSLSRAAARFRR